MANTKVDIIAVTLGVSFAVTGVFAFASWETFFGLLGNYYGVFNNHFTSQ